MGLIQGILTSLFPPMPEPLAEVRPRSLTMVRGIVVPRDVMECPLTGDRCVYYQYTVEDWRRSGVVGAGEGFWQMSERDEAILEFYLQDGSQRAIVAPHRARVERAKGARIEHVDLFMLDRRAQQLLIRPGDRIEVAAWVERVNDLFDEDRGYRSSPARVILTAPPDDQIVIRVLS